MAVRLTITVVSKDRLVYTARRSWSIQLHVKQFCPLLGSSRRGQSLKTMSPIQEYPELDVSMTDMGGLATHKERGIESVVEAGQGAWQ